MTSSTIEDGLRREYFDLLPDIRRIAEHLETVIRFYLLPITSALSKYEQVTVKSRVKECESAVDALRRRQEFASFDPNSEGAYTLTRLRDLAGVRVLAFPHRRVKEIDVLLRQNFPEWTADPVISDAGDILAYKYSGFCPRSPVILGEYQIASVLTGLFWEVEHDAIYKPSPRLRGITRSIEMKEPTANVYAALRHFEDEFERLIEEAE